MREIKINCATNPDDILRVESGYGSSTSRSYLTCDQGSGERGCIALDKTTAKILYDWLAERYDFNTSSVESSQSDVSLIERLKQIQEDITEIKELYASASVATSKTEESAW